MPQATFQMPTLRHQFNLRQTHSQTCPKYVYPVPLANCPSTLSEQAPQHISKRPRLQKVSCEYTKYGCKKDVLQNRITEHYKEKVHFHLNLVTKYSRHVTQDLTKVQEQLTNVQTDTQKQLNAKQREIDHLKTTANFGKNSCLYTQVKFSIVNFSLQKNVRLLGGPIMCTGPSGYKLQVRIFFQATKLDIELWHVETGYDNNLTWPLHCTLNAILRDSVDKKKYLRRSSSLFIAQGSYNTGSEVCISYRKIGKSFRLYDVLNFEVDVVVVS